MHTQYLFLVQIIELINDLVTSSQEIEDDKVKNKGYLVLSHILKKVIKPQAQQQHTSI